eukprot:CAMPEP_0204477648 /NCGR_PEP_ID=MMETSP0471-20130131/32755_1 /ASSEMBLY_ACC=CAM_ASM_000602 /TAXON_ID=2969 /ORGANISM="Oxyrrhis marina" /LENGTH=87 /DNA_ID=CAMNT_0051480411 /DNA_START=56 /DNA_END=315 /DNA_ORIENTATION=+
MAAVAGNMLSGAERGELACIYAAMILHDGGAGIEAEAIAAMVKAAGGSVDAHVPLLFARALRGKDVGKMLETLGSPGAGGAGGAAAP